MFEAHLRVHICQLEAQVPEPCRQLQILCTATDAGPSCFRCILASLSDLRAPSLGPPKMAMHPVVPTPVVSDTTETPGRR